MISGGPLADRGSRVEPEPGLTRPDKDFEGGEASTQPTPEETDREKTRRGPAVETKLETRAEACARHPGESWRTAAPPGTRRRRCPVLRLGGNKRTACGSRGQNIDLAPLRGQGRRGWACALAPGPRGTEAGPDWSGLRRGAVKEPPSKKYCGAHKQTGALGHLPERQT
ncbi:hypothetical protein NDU88_008698 [Pleurodeles waltl]|uniref:Uncharacterized protein n=1 Tax=Pleurodeles waltl TaxID=8319 RepID=A0AAV7QSH7_PLEWA|nr:hypothetical protein NDU88_008698 [Pleurodeles waltl]